MVLHLLAWCSDRLASGSRESSWMRMLVVNLQRTGIPCRLRGDTPAAGCRYRIGKLQAEGADDFAFRRGAVRIYARRSSADIWRNSASGVV